MRKEEFKNLNLILCALCVLSVLCVKIPSCSKTQSNNILAEGNEKIVLQTLDIPDDPLRKKAEQTAASMNDNLLVSQVIITGIDGRGSLPHHMKVLLEETPAGGVMLFRNNVNTDKDSIRAFIEETSSLITEKSGIAPFIAVDLEGGSVNRFAHNRAFPSASSLPSAASYWRRASEQLEKNTRDQMPVIKEIFDDAYAAASEIAALGINMNFAPVAEVLNDDNRDFLIDRSYGDDQFFVSEAAFAFLHGMREAGILCVPKHFPGSAGRDPHYTVSVMNHYPNHVYPFDALFSKERDARAVMIAHTLIPAIDSKIASLSSVVMNEWLREEMDFDGLIIADDFTMAAAAHESLNPEQTAVQSIAAGADMVLVWQSNLRNTHAAFIKALEDGTLTRVRLQEAVSRIIYEKLRMGIIN